MPKDASFEKSFNVIKTVNDRGYNLADWQFELNNNLNIVPNNPQIISIIRTNCGGLFKCADCGHKWTKKAHSTILFQCDSALHKIECKLFGHICLECKNNPTYHVATYTDPEIQDTIEFLRTELLQKLYPILFSPDHQQQLQVNQRFRPSPGYGPPQRYGSPQGYGPPQRYGPPQGYGPPQRYYNVDFANYCESCRRGDYCRLHRRN